ncbi:MAG: hypothetical protein IJM53_01375 [Lachnospiraceae bacterium]|nr:hypothetical protein [Lachnospiraceae bacterium]
MKAKLKRFTALLIGFMLLLAALPTISFGAFDDDADTLYIDVQKTFSGIAPEDIPSNFSITVTGNGVTKTLTKTDAEISDDGLVWRWRIIDVGTGEYTVTEANTAVPNYKLVSTTGTGTVTVDAATITYTGLEEYNENSHRTWPVIEDEFFAGNLTGHEGKGVFFLTEKHLSAAERQSVIEDLLPILREEFQHGQWLQPVYFFSIEDHAETGGDFYIDDALVTYDEDNREVTFPKENFWNHVVTGTYKVAEAADIEITNEYEHLNTKVALEVTKAIDGRDFKEGDEFTFTLAPVSENAPMPENSATATATASSPTAIFEQIKFEEEGTYTYTITETAGNLPGMTYDTASYNVTVTVTMNDAGDGFTATVSYDGKSSLTITNTFEPTEESIEVTKVLEGRDWQDTDAFVFTLASEDAPLPEIKTGTATSTAQTVTFGPIEFTEPGTYTYTVTETAGDIPGITYDTDPHTVTVTVTQDPDTNALSASVSYGDADKLEIKNTFTPVEEEITVTKVLEGRDWKDTDEFTFTLSPVDGAPEPDTTTGTATSSAKTVSFGTITFDAVGEYQYTIKETGGGLPGVTYDTSEHTVIITVSVAEDSNALVATVKYDGEDKLEITNTFNATEAEIEVTKALTGRDWKDTDEFTFTLTPVGSAPEPEITTGTATSAAKTVSFGSIAFDAPGRYTYTIKEEPGTIPGVTYDTTDHEVVVEVKQNVQTNKLTAIVLYDNDKELVVTNTFEPVKAEIEVTKVLEGRDWKDTDEFAFTLAAVDGAPEPDTTTGTATSAAKTVSFGDIEFSEVGTYTYIIKETTGTIAGVTYDTDEYTVTVEVTVNEDTNALEATVTYDGEETLEITNTFTPVTAEIEVTKALEGREWKDDDEFTFSIEATGEAPTPEETSATVTKDAQTATFGEIEFTETGAFEYIITEETGNIPGVAYDTAEHKVVVNVTTDDNNELVAEVTYDGEESLTITNTFSPVTAEIEVTKALEGREWADGDAFVFNLAPVGDAPMPEKTSGTATSAAKTVNFGEIEFTEVGTYEYTVTEEKGNAGGVTYDEKAHKVTITVSADDTNALTAEVAYDGGDALSITNTYKAEPVEVQIDIFKTVKGFVKGADSTFEFTLTGKDLAEPLKAAITTKDGKGSALFTLSFTEPGTYEYTVQETKGNVKGYTYDTSKKTVTIEVTDDGNGSLEAKVSPEKIEFTNTYKNPDVPDTSDPGYMHWLLLCIGSGLGMIAGLFAFRRKKTTR